MINAPQRLPRLLTNADAAAYLRVCTKTVRRLVSRGALPTHRAGNQIRIAEPDLGAYLAQSKK